MRRKMKVAALVAAMALSLAFRRDPAAVNAAPAVLHPVQAPSHDPLWDWRMHPELWQVLDQDGNPLVQIGVIGEPPSVPGVIGGAEEYEYCVSCQPYEWDYEWLEVQDSDPAWIQEHADRWYLLSTCHEFSRIVTDNGSIYEWSESGADLCERGAPTYEQIWLPQYGDVCNPINPYCDEWSIEYFPQYLLDWKELWNAPEQPGLVR